MLRFDIVHINAKTGEETTLTTWDWHKITQEIQLAMDQRLYQDEKGTWFKRKHSRDEVANAITVAFGIAVDKFRKLTFRKNLGGEESQL